MKTQKRSIINCHTHVFTGDHVPPWLAKSLAPWPFYYLIPLPLIVRLIGWWVDGPGSIRFKGYYKKWLGFKYKVRMFLARNFLLSVITTLIGIFVTINAFFICFDWLSGLFSPGETKEVSILQQIRSWLEESGIVLNTGSIWIEILFILVLVIFFKTGRNLILFLLKIFWKFLGRIPGKQTVALLNRYILIGRFSRYKSQNGIHSKLAGQYPKGTGIIALPMDMEYMGAGKPKADIYKQLEELGMIKKKHPKTFFPLIFADPRRMTDDPDFFSYSIGPNGEFNPDKTCRVSKWIEEDGFNGIKIYPALGYYPFDEKLLPLWKYAADNQIPVMVHCCRGTIYYRGKKEKVWDEHPVFMEAVGTEKTPDINDPDDENDNKVEFRKLLLRQIKNIDFTVNFTHPLNYICLLDERLLRKLVGQAKEDKIRHIFGFTNETTPLKHNLAKLKFCFGHFGGDDEWMRFLEKDRYALSNQLIRYPDQGINMIENSKGEESWEKLEQIWKYVDWYSIICSLMIQYPGVFADFSYILYMPEIMPLLKQTLQNSNLRKKVLFGTDFYVVRNHKSDKEMLADMMGGLSEEEFDQIARINPREYLESNFFRF